MAYLYRRFLFYLVALWAALTLNFALPRLMPGHPYDFLMMRYRDQLSKDPHFLDALKVELGASKDPMPVQYVHYLGNMLTLNFGISTSHYPSTVSEVLSSTLPWTLFLAGTVT